MNQQVINEILSYEQNEVSICLSRKKQYEQYKTIAVYVSHFITSITTLLSFLSSKYNFLTYISGCTSLLINVCIVTINNIHDEEIKNDKELNQYLKNMNVNITLPNDDQTTPINTPN